jgi:tRNA pseudouridine55 synthase
VSDPVVDGVLVCDKPAGMTSHDVVARVRRLAHQRRVGHGGTLDPPATGVLVVALGRATRLLPFLPMEPKRYLAGIVFGAETDTLDAAGTVTGTAPVTGIDQEAVARALERFVGPQRQVPPMVSAVKLDGERLYLKARRGETVERAPRPVTIHALELRSFQPGPPPLATVAVTCSGGTYVRVLAADLGRALGSLAHLASLRRTAVGAFALPEARTLADLEALSSLESALIDPAAALRSVSVRTLSEGEAAALATGQSLEATGVGEPVAAVAPDGRLVGVIQDGAGRARPKVVMG